MTAGRLIKMRGTLAMLVDRRPLVCSIESNVRSIVQRTPYTLYIYLLILYTYMQVNIYKYIYLSVC